MKQNSEGLHHARRRLKRYRSTRSRTSVARTCDAMCRDCGGDRASCISRGRCKLVFAVASPHPDDRGQHLSLSAIVTQPARQPAPLQTARPELSADGATQHFRGVVIASPSPRRRLRPSPCPASTPRRSCTMRAVPQPLSRALQLWSQRKERLLVTLAEVWKPGCV